MTIPNDGVPSSGTRASPARVLANMQDAGLTLDETVDLDLGLEDVGAGPRLRDGEAVLGVVVLSLEVGRDGVRLGGPDTEELERDVVGREGLQS